MSGVHTMASARNGAISPSIRSFERHGSNWSPPFRSSPRMRGSSAERRPKAGPTGRTPRCRYRRTEEWAAFGRQLALNPRLRGDERWREMVFHVYIMASARNGTLYIGMTDDLNRRVWEHQTEVRRGFTQRYGVHRLVWSEPHESRETAFARERAMKKWNRAWKIDLIEVANPQWRDLALDLEP